MSSELGDELEYPYGPRSSIAPPQAATPAAARPFPWRLLLTWLRRAAIGVGVLFLVVIIAAGLFVFRSASRARLLADLEARGCIVSYWHEFADNEDVLPPALRERLGDHWWSEVKAVTAIHTPWMGDDVENNVKAVCVACGKLPRLKSFQIASDLFSCDQIAQWPHLNSIEELDVESSQLTDADLAIIGRMTALKKLRLGSAKITTVGIGHLARLPRLESLTLEAVEIRVSGSMPSMPVDAGPVRNLDAVEIRVSGPQNAPGFESLTTLRVVSSPQLDDHAIIGLGPLPSLEDVNFYGTPLGDRGLAHLIGGGKVRSLIVTEGRLTDEGLAILADFPAPSWLALSGMPLTDAGLAALAGKEFPTLILDGTAITDEAFRTLGEIKGLEHVSFANTKVTGEGAKYLTGDLPLPILDLSGTKLTREGIMALAKANCSTLNLSQTGIGDEELLLLANSNHLSELHVTETSVTADGVETFYRSRKERFKAVGIQDNLYLISDFPDEVAAILGVDPITGMPIESDAVDPAQGADSVSPVP